MKKIIMVLVISISESKSLWILKVDLSHEQSNPICIEQQRRTYGIYKWCNHPKWEYKLWKKYTPICSHTKSMQIQHKRTWSTSECHDLFSSNRCIENKQNLYMYFTYLFENLPKLDLTNKEELRKYLPYSRELPSYIGTLSKSEIKAILNEVKSQVWSSKDGFIIYSGNPQLDRVD